jgi:cytochrome c oxidase subunit 4
MAGHVLPKKIFYRTFAALMILLVLTVAVWYVDLGRLNIYVAMTIAVVKALLVILFFMEVRYSSRLTWVFAGMGFIWLIILFGLTLADYYSRPWGGGVIEHVSR